MHSFLLFSVSLADPQISQEGLVCGETKVPLPTFVPKFAKLMEAVFKSVVQQGWGCANVSGDLELFALSQCYSDLSKDDCLSCFTESRTKLPACIPATSARIYLDGCFLRYDNYSFFSESIDPHHDVIKCSDRAGLLKEDYTRLEFEQKVDAVISNVTKTAVQEQGFAVAGAEGGAVPVYALAECWNTVDQKGCNDCLVKAESALRSCLPGSEGRALNAGCYLRYSTVKLYKEGKEKKSGNGKTS